MSVVKLLAQYAPPVALAWFCARQDLTTLARAVWPPTAESWPWALGALVFAWGLLVAFIFTASSSDAELEDRARRERELTVTIADVLRSKSMDGNKINSRILRGILINPDGVSMIAKLGLKSPPPGWNDALALLSERFADELDKSLALWALPDDALARQARQRADVKSEIQVLVDRGEAIAGAFGRRFTGLERLRESVRLLRASQFQNASKLGVLVADLVPVGHLLLLSALVMPFTSFINTKVANETRNRALERAETHGTDGMGLAIISLVLLMVLTDLLDALGQLLRNHAIKRYTLRLKSKVFTAVLRQDFELFDKEDTVTVTRAMGDAGVVAAFVVGKPLEIWRILTQIVTIFYTLYGYHPQLALKALAPLPLALACNIGMIRVTTHLNRLFGVARVEREAEGVTSSAIRNIALVRTFAREEFEHKRYTAMSKATEQAKSQMSLINHIFGVLFSLAMQTCQWTGMMVGARLIQKNELDPALFVMILQPLRGLTSQVTNVVNRFMPQLESSVKSADRIIEIISARPTIEPFADDQSGFAPVHCGDIVFSNVDFTYPSRPGARVLSGLSFTAAAGETTALVGQTGCGKSTALKLIVRLFRPDGGGIAVGGVAIEQLNPRALRNVISYMQQDPVLFGGTIRENLCYGQDAPPSEQELELACRRACCWEGMVDDGRKFPTRLSTGVGQSKVSGGERQRLVMARMLLRKPRILLLDEATSALDNDTERKLCAELDAMVRENRGTRVVIAHRLSTIQNADRILVMGNGSDDSGGAACKGNVCESGTHAELLARPGGKYAQLWNAAASASDAKPAEAAKPAAAAPDRVAPKAADGAELYSIAVPSHLSSHFASELNALARRLGCSSTDPSHDARRIVLTPIEASGHLSFRTAASAVMRTTSLHRTAAEADAAGDESDRAGDHEDLPPLIALQLERAATMN